MIKFLKGMFVGCVSVIIKCFNRKEKNIKCDMFEKEDWYHDVGVYIPDKK